MSILIHRVEGYLGNRGHFKVQEIKLCSTDVNLMHKFNPCSEVVSAHCSISRPEFRLSSSAYERWRKISPLSFQHLNCHPVFLFLSLTGRQVLVEEEEEQPGGEALTRRAAPKGEPDRRACRFPRAGKRGTAAGSGGAQEELQPLQEDHGSVRGQVRPSVRADLIKQVIINKHKQISVQYLHGGLGVSSGGALIGGAGCSDTLAQMWVFFVFFSSERFFFYICLLQIKLQSLLWLSIRKKKNPAPDQNMKPSSHPNDPFPFRFPPSAHCD